MEAFLAQDLGVTVARAGVREALQQEQGQEQEPRGAAAAATVTVFFLTSAADIEAWLQGPPSARARHVIAVCPCCVPPGSAMWHCLFVRLCEAARGGSGGVAAAPAAAAVALEGAAAPLLEGGAAEGGEAAGAALGRGARAGACAPNATLARELLQAIATKVPVALLQA
jgi:hypothetical protein